MSFKSAHKKALQDLDQANAEYQEMYKDSKEAWETLDIERDKACALISDVEKLIESIRHVPYLFTISRKKIARNLEKFISSEDLKQREKKDKFGAGAGVGVILGTGAVVADSFGEYFQAFLEKRTRKKFEINKVQGIIYAVLVLIAGISYFFSRVVSRKKTISVASDNIKKVKKATNELKCEYKNVLTICEETASQYIVVKKFYDKLSCYSGENYMSIPKDHRSDLKALKNHTETLSALLNKVLK